MIKLPTGEIERLVKAFESIAESLEVLSARKVANSSDKQAHDASKIMKEIAEAKAKSSKWWQKDKRGNNISST